ncbi:hypothetical protein, conserved [Eimeria brunetti]|uniref:Uncharacterized protein n=1 Tax=Eimeria brunetti TaxID=51314 RepID=U6LHD6_9EIME|nr:hypothetical protein, conserved [Eimeria brunetti]
MPLPSMPARALAQTIAEKQRTSTIFNDTDGLRRPSACGTDQQTQNFVRNLRAHPPCSHSVSRSSSVASQQRDRAQRNYMKATSSSRRRSRNADIKDDGVGVGRLHQSPVASNYSPSVSRIRSESPSRAALPPVFPTSSHAPIRASTVRQGPPLRPNRATSAPKNLQLLQPPSTLPNSALLQHERSCAGSSNHSWKLENGNTGSISRLWQQHKSIQEQQKMQGILSSSWTVRDPLTTAGSAHCDLEDADDGCLQLDASDQQELSQLTASLEKAGLLGCYADTSQANTASLSCAGLTSVATPSSSQSLSHLPGVPKGPVHPLTTGKRHHHMQAASGFTGHATDRNQQQQPPQLEPPQQHLQQQKAMLRSWACPPQPQGPSGGGLSTRGMERLGVVSSAPGSDKRPGVSPSDFGITAAPSGYGASWEGLWRLVGTLKFCLRFVVVLIVCLFRLLNTSYDTWSAAQFKKAFEEILAGPSYAGVNAETPKHHGTLEGMSVRSTTYSQQQQPQQPQQQHQQNLSTYSSRNLAAAPKEEFLDFDFM